MGLITFIPHLLESDSVRAEVIHPLGTGANGEEKFETQIRIEARDAAERMYAEWAIQRAEDEGFDNFCPVLRTLPNVQLVGIARLRYRSHSHRTAAWLAHLRESAEIAIERYRKMVRINDSPLRIGASTQRDDFLKLRVKGTRNDESRRISPRSRSA